MIRGFLLGKFLPPHRGHVFLCDFARNLCDQLTILVCSIARDPIPGHLRHQWMVELFPTCRVLHCTEDLPQQPPDHPDFWEIWRDATRRYHPEPIDLVFASEDYGHRQAAMLGARFVPCDPARLALPTAGRAVRTSPVPHWDDLPVPVRPYFVKRVCLFGPESTGKTTLATQLAAHFQTLCVPEYGRIYTDAYGTSVGAEDLRRIAEGHAAATRALARQSGPVLILDTDPVLTAVWSDMLLGLRDPWLDAFADTADLYLLTDIDFPWADDGTRYFADAATRRRFFTLCRAELERRNVPYVQLSGSPEQRLALAVKAVGRIVSLKVAADVPQ